MWLVKIFQRLISLIKNMPISNNSAEQQLIFKRSWSNTSKRLHNEKLGPGMKIMGKVIGSVDLSDIGRVVNYNQIVDVNEFEINNSKRLHHAIKMGWIEVIEDRGMLRRALVKQGKLIQPELKDNKEDLLEMAKEMAKVMAKEMLKDDTAVRELKNELTKEIRDLKEKITSETVIVEKTEKTFIVEEQKPEDIFIDIDEKKSGVKSSIDEVGKEKEEKEDLTDSLEKMKRFRRKPK